jgi:hypothetical protein
VISGIHPVDGVLVGAGSLWPHFGITQLKYMWQIAFSLDEIF